MLPYRWRGIQSDQTETIRCHNQPNMQNIKTEREKEKPIKSKKKTKNIRYIHIGRYCIHKHTIHIKDMLCTCVQVGMPLIIIYIIFMINTLIV